MFRFTHGFMENIFQAMLKHTTLDFSGEFSLYIDLRKRGVMDHIPQPVNQ